MIALVAVGISLGFILVVCIAFYSMYVNIVKSKNKVFEAFSAIDVQLKKRYDLIPNILTIANKFMEHERGLLEKITELRTQIVNLPNNLKNMPTKVELDNEIKGLMKQFSISVENYPNLKSDQTMINAMNTYNEVEEHISAARRFYNSAVLELNNLVEIFPSSLIASALGIQKQQFFVVEDKERKSINASDYLK